MVAIEVFRIGWEKAKTELAKEFYADKIPSRDEKILEDWYRIRYLYLQERDPEQFKNQRNFFNTEYNDFLDDPKLLNAVRKISASMSPESLVK